MNLLEQARLEINSIDKEMALLFERRMKAVEDVITYKMEHNLPIFDSGREDEVIKRNCELIQDEQLKDLYKEYIIFQMGLSKKHQQAILDQTK